MRTSDKTFDMILVIHVVLWYRAFQFFPAGGVNK
jgi:hypothetical protein